LANQASERREIEDLLRLAMECEMLKPYFHSIVSMENPLQIVGFEALARIELADGTLMSPKEFIPIAESTGLVVELGEYILNQACTACMEWPEHLVVAVNVSPTQLLHSSFATTVENALKQSGLPAHRLELEITESVLINDINRVEPIIAKLRDIGVKVALDDFGAGVCGLHSLRQIKVDKIKVDKSIIDDIDSGHVAINIMRSVWHIANEIGATVTAEGVDSIATAEKLAQENCAHELQGYLYGRPVSARDVHVVLEFTRLESSSADIVSLQSYAHESMTG